MYTNYAGLIFDMDGTLFNSGPVHRQCWREVLNDYGLQVDERRLNALNGSPTWRIAEEIIRQNQVDLDPHQLAAEKNQRLETLEIAHITLLPGADIAKQWHGKKPMAIGTGSGRDVACKLLKQAGLLAYFPVIVSADDVTRHKPAPETFLRCAELMGVPASQCVVFEDADFGVQAARRAGMDVVDVRLL